MRRPNVQGLVVVAATLTVAITATQVVAAAAILTVAAVSAAPLLVGTVVATGIRFGSR